MSYVKVERVGDDIVVMTLSAPEKLNAISTAGLEALLGAFDAAERDLSTRVVVLTGEGRAYCAGVDLTADNFPADLEEAGPVFQGLALQKRGWGRVMPRMRQLRLPIVAAVNGPAVGAGFALALGADVRIASTEATFNPGFQKLGISAAEMGLSWMLPRLVGLGRATEICLTGRTVKADEAERIGLVTSVVPPDELLDTARATAERIARHTPLGVWLTKDSLAVAATAPLASAIELEARSQLLAVPTDDAREMRRASRDHRAPLYTHR